MPLLARIEAGLLYATAPLALGAIAQGRLGELVFLAVAPALLAPWTPVLVGADSPLRGVGAPLASPSLAQLYQLRPGGAGLPGRWVGPLYPALALVAVLFAPAARRRQACWLLGVLLLAGLLAAWQGSALPGRFTAWPGEALVPGAVA